MNYCRKEVCQMNKQEETYFAALSKDRSEIADVLECRAVRGYKCMQF